jgi:hypothetical protein
MKCMLLLLQVRCIRNKSLWSNDTTVRLSSNQFLPMREGQSACRIRWYVEVGLGPIHAYHILKRNHHLIILQGRRLAS